MPGAADGNIEIDENPWASRECTEQPDDGEGDDDEMVDVWNPETCQRFRDSGNPLLVGGLSGMCGSTHGAAI